MGIRDRGRSIRYNVKTRKLTFVARMALPRADFGPISVGLRNPDGPGQTDIFDHVIDRRANSSDPTGTSASIGGIPPSNPPSTAKSRIS